jgi:hypothetical protein
MNLNDIKSYAGKDLKKSQINLLAKLAKLGVKIGTEKQIRSNPYTGKRHELEPLAVALYDFIIVQYHAGMVGRLFPVSLWDRTRYLFLELWPTEYYDLID